MLITLKRIIRAGFKTFMRNGLLSASSVLVMTITMVVILSVFLSTVLIKGSIVQLEKKVDINVYFKPEAPVERVLEFKKLVLDLPEVDKERTNFISREKALENFKKKHRENQSILEALEIVDDNPLGAVLNIKATSVSSYDAISSFIDNPDVLAKYGDLIENLNYEQNKRAIEKLNALISYTYKIGAILSGVLILISVAVTFNTMRLIIYTFKEEISVMRLVGASRFFARGPFVVEGIFYGIISAIFALFIV